MKEYIFGVDIGGTTVELVYLVEGKLWKSGKFKQGKNMEASTF